MTHSSPGLTDLGAAVRASSLAEVCWTDGGELHARGVTALWHAEGPALALPYADEPVARAMAASARVALTLTDPRGTGGSFRPLVASGRPRLLEDPEGRLFREEMMEQELLRFPPSRVLADSPLLRREHWWFLPRLVVGLDVDEVWPLLPRTAPLDHLLVTRASDGYDVRAAGVAGGTPSSLTLDLGGEPPPAPADAAVLFGQDASFPDLEQWSQWTYRGSWDGSRFAVADAPARTGLAPPLGVVARWRRQRAFERACRQALAAR